MLEESNELAPDHHALHEGTEEDGLRTAAATTGEMLSFVYGTKKNST